LQVIGDTWQAWPELQLKALKRMHTFAKEEAAEKQTALPLPSTPTSARRGKKLSRSFSSSSAQNASSWQSTFDDLAKSPGTRLLPLIKVSVPPSLLFAACPVVLSTCRHLCQGSCVILRAVDAGGRQKGALRGASSYGGKFASRLARE